ncbi:hypothetical protein [Candidatus Chlorohelix sp.]|uniref:hypothetical protein n=1 Tax=Candidatus Chlorohelix sp. TaxID=3139201 RepID=UPI0030534B1E
MESGNCHYPTSGDNRGFVLRKIALLCPFADSPCTNSNAFSRELNSLHNRFQAAV